MSTVGIGRTQRGTKLDLTDDDLLWAGRAAAREASSGLGWTAVLWSWLQLGLLHKERGRTQMPCREQPGRPLTFTWVVRCHSQPVNHFWRLRGSAEQVRVRSYLQSDAATWEALETGRMANGQRAPMQPKPGLKAHVYAWARGELPNPVPRLADFSAPGVSDVPPGALVVGGNAFFTEGESSRWPASYVTIEPATGLSTISTPLLVAGAGLTIAALVTAYFAWRTTMAANKPRRRRRRTVYQQIPVRYSLAS